MKRYILASLLMAYGFLALHAQTTQRSYTFPAPAATGLKMSIGNADGVDASRLNRIDNVLQEYVNKGWIAGATAIVAKGGKVFYYKSIGYNDIDKKTPLKNDAIFRIASQTKAITSVGIMMLYEEGRLLLDDSVAKYIPEFKNARVLDKYNAADTTYTTVPAKRPITIRDLLTHTSGIGYAQIGSPQMNAIYYKAGVIGGIGVDKVVLGDKMKILSSLPLFHQPGEKWTYGLNSDLLGYVIEVVSGMPLDQYFRQRIFEPLGMKDTYFYLPADKRNRLAQLYTEDSDHKLSKAPATLTLNGTFHSDYPSTEGTYFSGGGGLSSTAYDYAIFMQALLNGGEYNGKRILSPATIRMMTTNQLGPLTMWNGNAFGLGFEIVTEKNCGKNPLSVGSYSWGGMFSSSYWVDPKEKIVAQLFLNQYPMSHGEIHEKFKSVVYQALTE